MVVLVSLVVGSEGTGGRKLSLDLSLGVECGIHVLWRILWSKATEVGPCDFPSNPQASQPFSQEV